MPNHVSNKITFKCDEEQALKIMEELGGDERAVDFNSLIPTPLSVYQGHLSGTDDKDFGQHTWIEWNRANWNTKWNAYNCKANYKNGEVTLYFDTAWSIPYPFVIAFANKYELNFTHKYFDEGHNFWGVEKWKGSCRIARNRNQEDIKRELHIELRGWDSDADDDECA